MSAKTTYLVWSNEHNAWWKPKRGGYTGDVWQAGRYGEAEAADCCRTRSRKPGARPREVMVLAPENNWPEFTVDDLRVIASLMQNRIGQPYMWVAANEASTLRPEVRASMIAADVHASRATLDDGTPCAHMWVEDSYGSWGLSTTAPDQISARDGEQFNHKHLHFERTQYGETLTIEHFAPAGHRLVWVITLEGGA